MNHFPGSKILGRKDLLYVNIMKLKRKIQIDMDFIPKTYVTNDDWKRFHMNKKNYPNNSIWILKPLGSCCGRGITLITKRFNGKKIPGYLISDYIQNPHLLMGHKYDLRIYVVVTSYDPLKIYLFKNGLTRICTEPYSAE